MAAQLSTYFEEGFTAYKANRCREAALLFASAKETARLSGNNAEMFKAGFWEAESWNQAGEFRRAYARLFAILADTPEGAPAYERWLAEKKSFYLWQILGQRSRTERASRLERLEAFASSHPDIPLGDLPELMAKLAKDAADWAEALRRYEEAWTVYDDKGFLKNGKAFGALYALLRLDRREEALRWLDLLGQTEQDWAGGRSCFHQGQALLALFSMGDKAELDAARCALEEDLVGTQCGEAADTCRYFIVRLWLLLRPNDDPEDRYQPARHLLRQKPETGRCWNRSLAITDYRLAAVRHAAGVPPCDDYFYRQPQAVSNLVNSPNPDNLARRVKRARMICAHLRQEALILDRLNECTWYSGEALAREERLEEIVYAARDLLNISGE